MKEIRRERGEENKQTKTNFILFFVSYHFYYYYYYYYYCHLRPKLIERVLPIVNG